MYGYSSMFIDVAEPIKPPQQIALQSSPVRSMIRLKRFDNSDGL